MFTDKSDKQHVTRPDDVFHLGNLDRGESSLLLDVKQCDVVAVLEQETAGSRVEYVLAVWRLDFLGYLILQVLDHNLK